MYEDKLFLLFKYLREELNVLDILIIIGELGYYFGDVGFGKSVVEYK